MWSCLRSLLCAPVFANRIYFALYLVYFICTWVTASKVTYLGHLLCIYCYQAKTQSTVWMTHLPPAVCSLHFQNRASSTALRLFPIQLLRCKKQKSIDHELLTPSTKLTIKWLLNLQLQLHEARLYYTDGKAVIFLSSLRREFSLSSLQIRHKIPNSSFRTQTRTEATTPRTALIKQNVTAMTQTPSSILINWHFICFDINQYIK